MPNTGKREIDELSMRPEVSKEGSSEASKVAQDHPDHQLAQAQIANSQFYHQDRCQQQQRQFAEQTQRRVEYYDDLFQKERAALSSLIQKLTLLVEQIEDPSRREHVLQEMLSTNPKIPNSKSDNTSEEVRLHGLMSRVVRASYDAGQRQSFRQAAESGRQQAQLNSDNQAEELAPIVAEFQEKGVYTLQGIADALNGEGKKTKTGHDWQPSSVKLLLKRIKSGSDSPLQKLDDHTKSLLPVMEELEQKGITTLQGIANALNEQGKPTKSGNTWHPSTVRLLLQKIDKVRPTVGVQAL